MSLFLILIYSFYSGRDLTSLVSFEGMKYNTDDYFSNRIWNLDKRFNYNLTDKYSLSIDYLQENQEMFIKEYVTQSLPLILKDARKNMQILTRLKPKEAIKNLAMFSTLPVESRRDPNRN